ncbi:hypothetical protein GCM10009680_09740 [Streptomyces yatensis]|uniref:Uncharacterized protein n=1 Tax=Streptomyces yatensis TaxID=155177 RepID=A0ABN2GJ49_9ACTN
MTARICRPSTASGDRESSSMCGAAAIVFSLTGARIRGFTGAWGGPDGLARFPEET